MNKEKLIAIISNMPPRFDLDVSMEKLIFEKDEHVRFDDFSKSC
jgi:hypothetical protein